jgi:hypothetical protein
MNKGGRGHGQTLAVRLKRQEQEEGEDKTGEIKKRRLAAQECAAKRLRDMLLRVHNEIPAPSERAHDECDTLVHPGTCRPSITP